MDDAYATAKWANRMLRPLTSLHHRLGKYRELQSTDTAQQQPTRVIHKGITSHTSTKKISRDREDHDSDRGDKDPSWIPGESDKRRVKHKYVVRGERLGRRARIRPMLRSPETVKTLPGAIEIATPLITGKSSHTTELYHESRAVDGRNRENSSEVDIQSSRGIYSYKGRGRKSSAFPQQDSQWRASLDSANDANYVDIVQRLDVLFLKFLEKTTLLDCRNTQSIGNSRSLLSTVMRRLPQFIANEQELQDELDDEDDVDMADAYFTELESAYGSMTRGWQPLREAVRSQGIYLVYNMVQKHWITSFTASTLINKCIDAGQNDAVESLLAAQLSHLSNYNYPDSFDPWRSAGSVRDPIRLLHKYWTRSKNGSYIFRQLEKLLHRGVLPTEWMVTMPWKGCVVSATKSVSSGDYQYAAASKLIEAVLKSASKVNWTLDVVESAQNLPNLHADLAITRNLSTSHVDGSGTELWRCPVYINDALNNLVSSLIVALCSMCFVRMDQATSSNDDSYMRVVNTLTGLAVLTERELWFGRFGDKDQLPEAESLRRGYILLGFCLLRCKQDPLLLNYDGTEGILKETCEPFFGLLDNSPEIIKELSAMIGQVIRCCERGERAQCRQAQKLCTQLLGFEKFGKNKLSLFLGKVAVEVALDFAQYGQDAEDHACAADIQEKVGALRQRLNTGGKVNHAGGHNVAHIPSFRWEEGIGEWVAKTPLARFKGSVSRIMPQPIVEIGRRSSLSSGSGVSDPVSPGINLSIASKTKSLNVKRPRADDDQSRRSRRPRKIYKKTRQSARISIQPNEAPLIDGTKEYNSTHDNVDKFSSDESGGESDQFGNRSSSESPAQTKRVDYDADSDARHETMQKGRDFEIVIYNHYPPTPTFSPVPTSQRRGPGRPRKQLSQPSSMPAIVGHRNLARRSLIIPCSDGEDSDDELSFLS
ncbi:hypothetical protein BGW36DRAFT_385027 [Talaromyces proteolyticus]|uniref:Uncharacterized protein n=1 Tax=Talaromyces proteolyticus TaxID=1131652 RepID=A0AAD4PUX0_9EURO|nr:uncharacterized protein BGW36DRAFT_385027 [Talaromyces proteolyticus]KAH8692714.1 hypothetical protein BGW36DRAFT_385027 [Talaromyces proteolyticus]